MEEIIDGTNAKKCSRCEVLKLFSEFNKNSKERVYGLQYHCKACQSKYRAENKSRSKETRRIHYLSNKESHSAYNKKYYEDNKEHLQNWKTQWREGNKDKLKEDAARYRAEHKEEINEYSRLHYAENKQITDEKHREYYINNKEAVNKRTSEYAKNNRAMFNAWASQRRTAKLNRTPSWLTDSDLALIEDFYILAKALSDVTGESYHVDHIIPLQGELVSGLHCPSNLQILTAAENLSKSNNFTIE